jgi:hypothetical protein
MKYFLTLPVTVAVGWSSLSIEKNSIPIGRSKSLININASSHFHA